MSEDNSASLPGTYLVVAICSIGYWVVGMAVLVAGLIDVFNVVVFAWPITIVGVALDMNGSYHKVWNYGRGAWVAGVLLLFPIIGPLYSYARYKQLTA